MPLFKAEDLRRAGEELFQSLGVPAEEAELVVCSGLYDDNNETPDDYADRLAELSGTASLKDPKTRLQEYLQSRRLSLPEYSVVDVSGEAHAQSFRVQCMVKEVADARPTQGQGRSRRHAEQAAAELMLQQLDGG